VKGGWDESASTGEPYVNKLAGEKNAKELTAKPARKGRGRDLTMKEKREKVGAQGGHRY